jgi:hypothetical protein
MKQIGFDFTILLFLLLLGFFALIPVFAKKYLSKYFKTGDIEIENKNLEKRTDDKKDN